ncbi:hypothetical protein GGQ94_001993 [Petrimonas sulfuriphila]
MKKAQKRCIKNRKIFKKTDILADFLHIDEKNHYLW